MVQDLRKVRFTLDPLEGFNPDVETSDEQKWKEGFFHLFTHVEEKSPQSELFREKCVALIEDAETGRVHYVDVDSFKFTNSPQ